MEMKNKINGIVVRVEDHLQMFLLNDDNEILDMPSIPITDDEHIYDFLKKSQIQFVNVEFEKKDPNDNITFETYDDFEKLIYHIKDVFSITMGKKQEEDEEPKEIEVLSAMKEKVLSDIVKNAVNEYVSEENS